MFLQTSIFRTSIKKIIKIVIQPDIGSDTVLESTGNRWYWYLASGPAMTDSLFKAPGRSASPKLAGCKVFKSGDTAKQPR